MTYSDFPKRKRQPNDGTALGLALLIPLVLVLLVVQLRPVMGTFTMSLARLNFLTGENTFIGFENYSRVLSDAQFWNTLKYNFLLIVTRIIVLAFVPAIIGMMVGVQGQIGRILNRFLLGFLGALIAPVALIVLWRLFWFGMWGREPSPIGRDILDVMMLNSVNGAITSTLLLDAVLTMAITVVVGSIVYIAVLRGRETHPGYVMKVGISVWVIGLVYAVGSALTAFVIPFLMTAGGPGGATRTLMILGYERGFRALQMGPASVYSILLLIPIVMGVVLVWFLITTFRIRLIRVPNNESPSGNNPLSIISIPVIALIFLPITGLLLWGHYIAFTQDGFSAAIERLNLAQTLPAIVAPVLAIWLIQIPITYLAAAALGLMRPVNRTVTNIIFLVLLVLAFLPTEVLMYKWYTDAGNLGMLNTRPILAMPWFVSGISLLVFKLFFDGLYEEIQSARENSEPIDRILQKVIVSSLPIVALVGLVMTFMSIQSFLWPMTTITSADQRPWTVNLFAFMVGDVSQTALTVATAVIFFDIFFLPFALAFGLLSGFGLEKYALVGGDGDSFEPTPFSDLLGNQDDAGMAHFSPDDADLFLDE